MVFEPAVECRYIDPQDAGAADDKETAAVDGGNAGPHTVGLASALLAPGWLAGLATGMTKPATWSLAEMAGGPVMMKLV